jgi:putative sigma-54 modulation protein
MIASIEIVGINFDVDEATRKYVHKRIGRLDKYLPKHARATAYANVRLSQVNHDHGNKYEAEVRLDIPEKSLNVRESTVNIFAAIDIVEAKLKSQIDDYKQSHVDHIGNRRLMSRFKKSFQREL